jgi:hypothetical protein
MFWVFLNARIIPENNKNKGTNTLLVTQALMADVQVNVSKEELVFYT